MHLKTTKIWFYWDRSLKTVVVMTFFPLEQEKQHLQDRTSHHRKFGKAALRLPSLPAFLHPPSGKRFLVPGPADLPLPPPQERELKAVCSGLTSNPLAALAHPGFPRGPRTMDKPWFWPKLYAGEISQEISLTGSISKIEKCWKQISGIWDIISFKGVLSVLQCHTDVQLKDSPLILPRCFSFPAPGIAAYVC